MAFKEIDLNAMNLTELELVNRADERGIELSGSYATLELDFSTGMNKHLAGFCAGSFRIS